MLIWYFVSLNKVIVFPPVTGPLKERQIAYVSRETLQVSMHSSFLSLKVHGTIGRDFNLIYSIHSIFNPAFRFVHI